MCDFCPLSNGKVPAAKKSPTEHWNFMRNNLAFVREMTEPLHSKTKATDKVVKKVLKQYEIQRSISHIDYGGVDGHVAESGDLRDLETIRVTRCTTTRSAITAYMCGANIATNHDMAHGVDRKMGYNIGGTKSFRIYLACLYRKGISNGNHRRSVYRLGIGCKDEMAGYSHAFSIVAQPDGTFFWLQSFISHYSLATWMKMTSRSNKSGLAGHLTFDELLVKLDKIDRLTRIDDWTAQANQDYLDLFNVDKTLENGGRKSWTIDHRLDHFSWDEACEYPLPDGYKQESEDRGDVDAQIDITQENDECSTLLGFTGEIMYGDLAQIDISYIDEIAN